MAKKKMELHKVYQERAAALGAEAQHLRQRYERLSWVRLALFLTGIAFIILIWSWEWWVGMASALLFIGLFFRFVQWHLRYYEQAVFLENKQTINEQEMEALTGETHFFGDGSAYIDATHPYAYDLDVYGPHALFPFLNRSTTLVGEKMLAGWLAKPTNTEQIRSRQSAVRELVEQLEWRQDFRAKGLQVKEEKDNVNRLLAWVAEPALVANNQILRVALWLYPIWLILGIILWIYYIPWYVFLLFLAPAAYLLKQNLEAINRLHSLTTHSTKTLRAYAQLIAHIEEADFADTHLQQVQAYLGEKPSQASRSIKKLAYALSQLDVRHNVFVFLLEFSVLWDLQWVYQLDKWKEKHRTQLENWFIALAEMEALSSLANAYYNQSDWVFPEIDKAARIEAIGLGHPLILSAQRVSNDMQMPTRGHIHLITGSNMAGKSTWLRTVGLNMVLALAGAPVCAERFRLPQLQVYTSMRTQDALHESTSSFYAELKRLKFIIEAVKDSQLTDGRPVFFLLDEILKGTNSRDRHRGAKALIRQLILEKGGGLIATHDLELGMLENETEDDATKGRVENWRIEVEIEDGQLHFDYKLKRGVSESFNASLLMRQMGIEIQEE